jgi:hypothetical protein
VNAKNATIELELELDFEFGLVDRSHELVFELPLSPPPKGANMNAKNATAVMPRVSCRGTALVCGTKSLLMMSHCFKSLSLGVHR